MDYQQASALRNPNSSWTPPELLGWLAPRLADECRLHALETAALQDQVVSSRRQFRQLIEQALAWGAFVRQPVQITRELGRLTPLLDWTPLGRTLYRHWHQAPMPRTFLDRTCYQYRTPEQVYLALTTREWLLRTGYAARSEDVDMLPKYLPIRPRPGSKEIDRIKPHMVLTRPYDRCLAVELVTGLEPVDEAAFTRWYDLAVYHTGIGVVIVSTQQMQQCQAAFVDWQKDQPPPWRQARVLFTSLQTLRQRLAPAAADPLPAGTFWLAEWSRPG
ncbi:MAG: hypothetical protein KKA73_10945 [Chloroflexi bacterium]|nr:hypothetical protein [Chloroflexota bacterium]MBU1748193.1 hypothetical protein [Chloroflexota bacterium]